MTPFQHMHRQTEICCGQNTLQHLSHFYSFPKGVILTLRAHLEDLFNATLPVQHTLLENLSNIDTKIKA